MASLLERLGMPPSSSTGPVRSRGQGQSRSNTPYSRAQKTPKGDIDSPWSHDLFEDKSLSARLSSHTAPPKTNLNNIAQKALREATASQSEPLSIKGASSVAQGNVVDVTGLVAGTTAEDVAAIFKRCGQIVGATIQPGPEVKIRVTFKAASSATSAVQKFNNQPADGKILSVRIVGSNAVGTTLGGRLGGVDGLGLVREEGSVDILMEQDNDSGSKLRSDSLIRADPRAQILLAPPGANTADYVQAPLNPPFRGGRRGGRARGRVNRGGRDGGSKMVLD